ncbi:MAG: exopolysaccharide biosynthesis polyprenyl glycosylphosphotransferase, partial [bacterium]
MSPKTGSLPSRSVQRAKTHWHLGSAAWMLINFIAGFCSCWLAFRLSPIYGQTLDVYAVSRHATPFNTSVLFAFCLVATAQIFNLHTFDYYRNWVSLILHCLAAIILALIVMVALLAVFAYTRIGRVILFQAFFFSSALMISSRALMQTLGRHNKRKITLIGDLVFFKYVEKLISSRGLPFQVVAVLHWRNPNAKVMLLNEENASFDITELRERSEELDISEIVTDRYPNLSPEIHAELGECLLNGIQVSSMEAFAERLWRIAPIDHIDQTWLHDLDLRLTHPFYIWWKRAVDICASLVGGILSLPFLLLAAIAIKLQDGGPIFYSQTRVGRFGHVFKLHKLRSMAMDAEQHGAQWAQKKDPRVTFIGTVLRKTRIDEVPQFWNILRGEMSLIGPRPERPEFVEKLQKEIQLYRFRHLVNPGLTGWAQI